MKIKPLFPKYPAKAWAAAFIIVTLFTGCGQSGEKPYLEQQSSEEKQEFDKAPQKLTSIEDNIEKLFKALDGPMVMVKEEKKEEDDQQGQQKQEEPSKQEETQQQEESKPSGEGDSNKPEQQSQGEQQNSGKQQQKQAQTPEKPEKKDPWKEINGIISNLHYQWNDFMPDAVKKGADPKITGNFSNALNTLTNTVKSKDKITTLKDANNLYGCVFELYTLYRTKMSPEIKRMRYLIRNTILDSMQVNWDQADKDSASINASWSLLKNTMGKDQQDDTTKLDFSILELEKVIAEKNASLTDIKGRVALSNIQSIEKSYEKDSG